MTGTVARRWWRCGCGKTLGEIVGERVVIRVADRVIVAPAEGTEQICSCGRANVLECDAITSQAG